MKRFWDQAGLDPTPDGHAILLDGKPVRLPGGAALLVGPAALAEAIAAEWQAAGGARGGEMGFADTPLTRLAGTAQERIGPDPWPTVDAIARYGESDLLCYRAEAPETLVRRQHEAWQPWLDWAARVLAAPLRVGSGVAPLRQHQSSIATLRRAVAEQDALALAALGVAVPALGSLVLGLALAEGALDAATAHALGALDEIYQAELWGEDAEAAARRRAVAADIALAARFLALARGGSAAMEEGEGTWRRSG
jgi:chaperone required for assembly of F1-ATPase